jgi:hypothetical protein
MHIVQRQRALRRHAFHLRQRTRCQRGAHQRLAVRASHLEHEVVVAKQRVGQRPLVLQDRLRRRQFGQDVTDLHHLVNQFDVVAIGHLPRQRLIQVGANRHKGGDRDRRQQQRHTQRQRQRPALHGRCSSR